MTIEHARIHLNKQGSEYATSPKHVEILSMAGCQYASVTQRSEYAKICHGRILSISISGSEYARILNMTGF